MTSRIPRNGATTTVSAWAAMISLTGEVPWASTVTVAPKASTPRTPRRTRQEESRLPQPRPSESSVPPAVALAIMAESAAPKNPSAKMVRSDLAGEGLEDRGELLQGCAFGAALAAEDGRGGGDHEGGHDAGGDDAGDGVGDGGLAVLVAAQTAFTGGVAGVERGVEGEVRADQRHEEQPDAARDARGRRRRLPAASQSGWVMMAVAMNEVAMRATMPRTTFSMTR